MERTNIRCRSLSTHSWTVPCSELWSTSLRGPERYVPSLIGPQNNFFLIFQPPAFRGPDKQINIFRPDFHAARLSHSASYVSIPSIPTSHFLTSVKLAVARNAAFVAPHASEALLYIRPLVFGSSGLLALTTPTEFTLAIYAQPGTTYHGVQPLDALVLEDFDRAAPHGTGSAKVGGNYAPVVRWSDAARREGFGITLHLDAATRTQIEEFSTSGFIGVRKSKKEGEAEEGEEITLVVPDSQNIVQSVTSDSCLKVAESLGWKVEKRAVSSAMPDLAPWHPLIGLCPVRSNGPNARPSPKSSPSARPLRSYPSSPSLESRQMTGLSTVARSEPARRHWASASRTS